MNWESSILELLSATLVRPFILIGAAALLLRILRVEHPGSKHAVWTFVLGGMLLLPVISVTVPHVNVPAMPAGAIPQAVRRLNVPMKLVVAQEPKGSERAQAEREFIPAVPASTSLPASPVTPAVARRSLTMEAVLVWCYLAGVVVVALRRLFGWILLRRLLSRSRPLRQNPLRESDDVTIPVVVGIRQPAVVLPASWREWNVATRRSILAHEIAHIRRRDAWTLMLSRWVTCLLWFHPIAWWVSRRTKEYAEMACDAVAVRGAGDAAQYAKILLEFSAALNQRGYRAAFPGLAMVGRSPLGRRIEQILAGNTQMRRLRWPATVAVLVGVPALCVSATLGLSEAVSRPLVEAKRIVASTLEAGLPLSLSQQPLPALALSTLGLQVVTPPPQQSTLAPREFLTQYCLECHNTRASVGGIQLDQVDLSQLQRDAGLWEKAIRKLRGGVQVMGAAKPDPQTIRSFVDWAEGELDRRSPVAVRKPLPHRLNRTEYRNAVRDLLDIDIDPALLFPTDDSTQGFDNIAEALEYSPVRPELYKAAADRITDLAMASPSRRKVFVCQPAVEAEDKECARKIIENLATKAFRSPATPEDVNALMRVFETSYEIKPFRPWTYLDGGIDGVVRKVLEDRRFVYRTEAEPSNTAPGQTYPVSDIDLASRLSFFLWSSGPDDQLLDLARRGLLKDAVVLERETRRMLKDSKAEALTLNFAAQWLGLRSLQRVQPTPGYADFDEPLRQAMRREAELFFNSVVQEDRNVLDLITADYTFLNERLARHYGIPGTAGPDFRRVTLAPAFDARRGLLGKAALLTVTSRDSRTSITTRGSFVLRRLLGVHVPDPPPNIPPMPPRRDVPMRKFMDQQLVIRTDCQTCHKIFDPIGIALDNFDLAGKWRMDEYGESIDPVTTLADGTKLSGPADVRNAIVARSDLFRRSLTMSLLTYALGRSTGAQDMPLVRSIVRDAAQDNNRFSAIVVGIVKSPTFRLSVKN